MQPGQEIGHKFASTGQALEYPGNTVISDVEKNSPAYLVMSEIKALLKASELASHFILLPEDSYHMTVIRGVNHLVRIPAFWPEGLALDTPMPQMDAYVAQAVHGVINPGPLSMVFGQVSFDKTDVRVELLPQDAAQAQALTAYRNQVAQALRLWLPGHAEYRYHITLAYVRWVVPPQQQEPLNRLKQQIDRLLKSQPTVTLDAPYMAYYQNMEAFFTTPPARS